jgi:hypothetical protein
MAEFYLVPRLCAIAQGDRKARRKLRRKEMSRSGGILCRGWTSRIRQKARPTKISERRMRLGPWRRWHLSPAQIVTSAGRNSIRSHGGPSSVVRVRRFRGAWVLFAWEFGNPRRFCFFGYGVALGNLEEGGIGLGANDVLHGDGDFHSCIAIICTPGHHGGKFVGAPNHCRNGVDWHIFVARSGRNPISLAVSVQSFESLVAEVLQLRPTRIV